MLGIVSWIGKCWDDVTLGLCFRQRQRVQWPVLTKLYIYIYIADAVAKRYRPWPKGLRTDSLPWFDSPLVQSASRLRYTDKAQVAATGPYWPKGARNKKKVLTKLYSINIEGHKELFRKYRMIILLCMIALDTDLVIATRGVN